MIAIDTNLLVRLFVEEENQDQINLVKQLLAHETEVYLSQMVQMELVWVLESTYEFSKAQVIFVLQTLENHRVFILENRQQFIQALRLFENSPADFSDYLIFSNATLQHYPFWTFDKKLARTQGVNHLKNQFKKLGNHNE